VLQTTTLRKSCGVATNFVTGCGGPPWCSWPVVRRSEERDFRNLGHFNNRCKQDLCQGTSLELAEKWGIKD
jgi:hypothetical protein